jgi:hypothetical protein
MDKRILGLEAKVFKRILPKLHFNYLYDSGNTTVTSLCFSEKAVLSRMEKQ